MRYCPTTCGDPFIDSRDFNEPFPRLFSSLSRMYEYIFNDVSIKASFVAIITNYIASYSSKLNLTKINKNVADFKYALETIYRAILFVLISFIKVEVLEITVHRQIGLVIRFFPVLGVRGQSSTKEVRIKITLQIHTSKQGVHWPRLPNLSRQLTVIRRWNRARAKVATAFRATGSRESTYEESLSPGTYP